MFETVVSSYLPGVGRKVYARTYRSRARYFSILKRGAQNEFRMALYRVGGELQWKVSAYISATNEDAAK
jgi:hypothetical protein